MVEEGTDLLLWASLCHVSVGEAGELEEVIKPRSWNFSGWTLLPPEVARKELARSRGNR